MIRYAITTGEEDAAAAAARWVAHGVDFVQLRDKSLDSGEIARRARALLGPLRETKIKLMINGRVDVALAVKAAGVHLTSHPDELTPAQVRVLMPEAIVSVSCHTIDEVERAREDCANWILFGPVFEKRVWGMVVADGVGLEALREACAAAPGKVLALGGVTAQNVCECIDAGAAGVAAIRLFEATHLAG